jgi:cellulose synthase/poly-beta-1,6-N-acetylglucosamine synthase-like glycosyltransferase
VDYASANGLLVTRRAWDAVGGFDERYFPAYSEDVDLCLKLSAHGYRVRYEPRARLVHLGSQGTSRAYREFLLARNQQKLVDKWGRVLDRFEPPPRAYSRPERQAAMERAINRAVPDAERPPLDDGCSPQASPDPTHETERLREDYFAFLKQRALRQDRRITELETYISGLWSVQLRCWVASRLEKLRYRVAPRRH